MMSLRLRGADELGERWSSFGSRAHQRLLPAMARLGSELQARVIDNLSGAVLRRRTGRLAAAQTVALEDGGDEIGVSVGFDPSAMPYGAIHEFGGRTRAHLIAAKSASALAFTVRGRLVFAKRVNHPGSVEPERSFLRSALAAMDDQGRTEIDDAMSAELGS
jgi:phage gpG-like protein